MLGLTTKGYVGSGGALLLASKGYVSTLQFEPLPVVIPPYVVEKPAWQRTPSLVVHGDEAWLANMPTAKDLPSGIILPGRFEEQTLPRLNLTGREGWLLNIKAAIRKLRSN